MPLKQKPVEPTHSVVEVCEPYLVPPDPEDADIQNMNVTAHAVQLNKDKGIIKALNKVKPCIDKGRFVTEYQERRNKSLS